MGRGIAYSSYLLIRSWSSGITLLLLCMVTSFLGYVLPFGQMSLWGATVITNLLRTIPLFGNDLVAFVWGGFTIGRALNLYALFHFFMPFIILLVIGFHLLWLHETGRTSPIHIHESDSRTGITPMFITKDLLILGTLVVLEGLLSLLPFASGDPENWSHSSPMRSPIHIQPEWYFLFAYAILRCIPNKLGGVIAFVWCVGICYLLCLSNRSIFCWHLGGVALLIQGIFTLLLCLGRRPVTAPFILVTQVSQAGYYAYLNPTPLNS